MTTPDTPEPERSRVAIARAQHQDDLDARADKPIVAPAPAAPLAEPEGAWTRFRDAAIASKGGWPEHKTIFVMGWEAGRQTTLAAARVPGGAAGEALEARDAVWRAAVSSSFGPAVAAQIAELVVVAAAHADEAYSGTVTGRTTSVNTPNLQDIPR